VSYFNRQWTEEIVLPDGSTASCQQDVDRFLKENQLALAGDYSDEFRKKVRLDNERTERRELWAEFIRNYKRSIWYAKK
jgi:hypothetical protein